jgi:hypothetical protein
MFPSKEIPYSEVADKVELGKLAVEVEMELEACSSCNNQVYHTGLVEVHMKAGAVIVDLAEDYKRGLDSFAGIQMAIVLLLPADCSYELPL